MTVTDLLESALNYAAKGWRVIPLHTVVNSACTCSRRDCSSSGKHPRTKHGLKDAATSEAVIRAWWTNWPTANVGIATGAESGLVVLLPTLSLINLCAASSRRLRYDDGERGRIGAEMIAAAREEGAWS